MAKVKKKVKNPYISFVKKNIKKISKDFGVTGPKAISMAAKIWGNLKLNEKKKFGK